MIYKSYWLAGLSSGQYKLLIYRICPFSSQPPQEGGGSNTRGVGDEPGVTVGKAVTSGVGMSVDAAWGMVQPGSSKVILISSSHKNRLVSFCMVNLGIIARRKRQSSLSHVIKTALIAGWVDFILCIEDTVRFLG